jgi:hypothetical protein
MCEAEPHTLKMRTSSLFSDRYGVIYARSYMIQIKGQFTLDDFKKAHQLYAQQKAVSAPPRIYLILIAMLFFICLIILVILGHLAWSYLLASLALLGFFLLYQYLYRPYLLARTFKNHPDLSAPFEMELSDQGMSITNLKGSALIPWTDYVKWLEGKELILLYRSYIMFQMIPKRLFATENDLQYLREQLARNNVPDAGKADKRVPVAQYIVYIILVIAILVVLYWNLK